VITSYSLNEIKSDEVFELTIQNLWRQTDGVLVLFIYLFLLVSKQKNELGDS